MPFYFSLFLVYVTNTKIVKNGKALMMPSLQYIFIRFCASQYSTKKDNLVYVSYTHI